MNAPPYNYGAGEHALGAMFIALADELFRTNPQTQARLLAALASLERAYQSAGHDSSSNLVGIVRRELGGADRPPPASADILPFRPKQGDELAGDVGSLVTGRNSAAPDLDVGH